MNLLIYGQNTEEIQHLAGEFGIELAGKYTKGDDASADIVVAICGGDGTLMQAEAEYPEAPKFIIQKSKTAKKGTGLEPRDMMERLSRGRYKIDEEIKIVAEAKGKTIIGLNEIIVHNADPRLAIRYELFVNDKQIGGEIIGDGVVIATPYGSTGYYRSITDSFFEVGIGIAFNNSTEQSDHMVIRDDVSIRVKIVRGKAVAYADNNPEEVVLLDGDEIIIKKSADTARIVRF